MPPHWKKSPLVGLIAAIVVLIAGCWTWRSLREPSDVTPPLGKTSSLGEALGLATAAETIHALGSTGGEAVLVVPAAAKWYRDTICGAYEKGFRAGLTKQSPVKLAGLYFAPPPCGETQLADWSRPTFERLQDVRRSFPKAQVIVSFLGLPQFSADEQKTWLDSHPPKMIVVNYAGLRDGTDLQPAIRAGLLQAVLSYNDPATLLSLNPPGTPQEIIANFFNVVRAE